MSGLNNPCAWLPQVVALAEEAGRKIMEVYARGFDIEHKQDRSPLTEADMAAHHLINAGLNSLTPGLPVLSEEAADIAYATRAQWGSYWLVDPLDGTREFIKRNGEFTVNIALICDQRPVLGVVYVPVSGVAYYACAGRGAYRVAPGVAPQAIKVRPWPGGHIAVVGSRSHRDESFDRFLGQFADYEIISMGSSLKFCLVAEGKADIYPRLGPTSEWDTAAAQCIVEEAGGKVLDMQLAPLRYNTKHSLLNPFFIVCGDTAQDWGKYLSREIICPD